MSLMCRDSREVREVKAMGMCVRRVLSKYKLFRLVRRENASGEMLVMGLSSRLRYSRLLESESVNVIAEMEVILLSCTSSLVRLEGKVMSRDVRRLLRRDKLVKARLENAALSMWLSSLNCEWDGA